MKKIFIIPGFKQSTQDDQYSWMHTYFKKKGLVVQESNIHWDHKVMTDYVEEFSAYYTQHKGEKNYVLGFSFGAMIAIISAQVLQPDGLYLCSLSAYFKEDHPYVKPSYLKTTGKKRIDDFKHYKANEISKRLSIPTTVFYGTKEGAQYPRHKYRNEKTAELLENGKLIVVQDGPHRVDYPTYVEAIKKAFDTIFI